VIPFWIGKIASGTRGYVENLTAEGEATAIARHSPLVTSRLVYCFSHAHLLGCGAPALAAAEQGFSFLTECGWDRAAGGFLHEFGPAGEPLSRDKQAYDMAYVLFAMGWLHRASGNALPLDWAARTVDYLDGHLLDRRHGGYRVAAGIIPAEKDEQPRQLAAQMHLLEAFQALYEATGDSRWRARAEAMADFIVDRLVDSETGSLGELYTADWALAPGSEGEIREPGDNFEVAWLLYRQSALSSTPRFLPAADRLYDFSLGRGFDAVPGYLPAAFAQVTRRGAVVNGAKPLWAQTEVVKAALGRFEAKDDPAAAELARRHLALIFRRYLIEPNARWRNELARDGTDRRMPVPVRVLYHLMLCFAETMRLWPKLQERA
jgi:mannose/cellobiose epimerase-like protein (N-acyl-D-glucosamine 2-epimerase family)